MICSFSTVSISHAEVVYRNYPRRRFGLVQHFQCEPDETGRLAQGEDLYLLGHYSGRRFGPPSGHPGFSPAELATWLWEVLLPPYFLGDIYIGTDRSARPFTESLARSLNLAGNNRLWHAAFPPGDNLGPIHILNDRNWRCVSV